MFPDVPVFAHLDTPRGQVDFEGELAIIIGRDCKNVSVDEALNYVLGYVPDHVPPSFLVRSRCALRHAHTQVHDRKRRQRTAVAREEGRWSVVPLQSVRYVLSAGAWCRAVQRGGPRQLAYHHTVERRGDAGFKHVGHGTCGWHGWLMVGVLLTGSANATQVFSVAEIVSFLSQDTTLLHGTVILTGTPEGVGFTRDPPVFLSPGDVVEVSIEGLGTLVNPVVAEATPSSRWHAPQPAATKVVPPRAPA